MRSAKKNGWNPLDNYLHLLSRQTGNDAHSYADAAKLGRDANESTEEKRAICR